MNLSSDVKQQVLLHGDMLDASFYQYFTGTVRLSLWAELALSAPRIREDRMDTENISTTNAVQLLQLPPPDLASFLFCKWIF
jgi:hypothetical protein